MDYIGYRWAGPVLASFCFFQQPDHVHWLSDIVVGGLFGYWLASSILDTPEIEQEKRQNRTSIILSPYNSGVILNLLYSF